uniref:Retrovirus-related Pol polyprotein from transposon TNT 1-94 n=1 Tax=Talaromyces marneffei PM1 TaxID=1077442 RepID=A0A093ULP4_TALMA
MRKGARLPFDLWPEIVRAAVYLYNQTPRYASNWKTPYDRFTTHAAWKNRIVIENQKPQLAHLKVYGCKAYALTTEYMKKENRRQRFNPRAWIGYLVGYDSTNVYRIWNPTTGRIIRTRDVIFNEDEVFSGNIEHLKDDLLHVYSFDDEYADLIDHMTDVVFDGDTVNIEPDRLKDKYTYPTPPETPPSALLAASITIVSNNDLDLHQSSALAAGTSTDGECTGGTLVQEATARERIGGAPSGVGTDRTSGSRADIEERTGGALNLRDSMDCLDETHGKQFPGDRLGESLRKNRECLSETPIRTNAASLTTQQGELNPWRFAFLAGTRISLLVSDLPPAPKSHREVETHPLGWLFEEAEKAHLKSHDPYRSWTTVPIGKAKGKQILDFKCKARLVVKVIKKKRYMRDTYAATLAARSFRTFMAIAAASTWNSSNMMLSMPSSTPIGRRNVYENGSGYREPGKIYQLNKALYGLRRSPLLWQKELTSTLIKLGFKTVPHEPCCMLKSGVMLFFYVDDIVVAYKKSRQSEADSVLKQLRAKYNISGGEDLVWFLGMRIIRDRSNKVIWLSQATYIDKIAKLADTRQTDDTPMSREELLPYEGTATHNSQRHYQRKVGSIMYAAVSTRPDVAFAISRLARFLSNPGPKHHKAADKVLCYLERHQSINTYLTFLDNKQTLGLLEKDAPRLRTKLRHVDIHNHWVRQEVQKGDVQVHYMPTKDMIANGLTKALSKQEHQKFLKQIGIENIDSFLAPHQIDMENPDIEELLSLNYLRDNV